MYTQLITAISNMFTGLFKFKKAQIENQATKEIIDEKKDYKKATNIAEKLIKISLKYKSEMSYSDRLKFINLINDFEKHN